MQALSRAGGLVLGESRVQVVVGDVGELPSAGMAVQIEHVSRARKARKAIGIRLTKTLRLPRLGKEFVAPSRWPVAPIRLVPNDASILLPPVILRPARSRHYRDMGRTPALRPGPEPTEATPTRLSSRLYSATTLHLTGGFQSPPTTSFRSLTRVFAIRGVEGGLDIESAGQLAAGNRQTHDLGR